MIGYIYKTTNLINKKIYIGQHTADKFDTNYLGSGLLITKAINEYGKANFKVELLCWCDSSTELNEKEKYYIKLITDSCKGEHVTMNCGNHKSVVFVRGNISNLVPECKKN